MTLKNFVLKEFQQLQENYPELVINNPEGSGIVIKGLLDISASYNGVSIEDSFQIELLVPDDYPESVPVAKETGGRIPDNFHKNGNDILCLGASLKIKKIFNEQQTLLGFVDNLVVPYLYSYSFKEKYEEMPYGELAHGGRGILDYYKEEFATSSDTATLKMLRLIAEEKYKGHLICPCGSGKKLRYCHGLKIHEISQIQNKNIFYREYLSCVLEFIFSGMELPLEVMHKNLDRQLKQIHPDLPKAIIKNQRLKKRGNNKCL